MKRASILFLGLAIFCGCAPGDKTLGPPDRFQNIRLGMTSGQFLALNRDQAEQLDGNVWRLNSPTDTIEFLDSYFTKDGSHLYKIRLTHFLSSDVKDYERFIQKCGKKCGEFRHRKQREVEGLEHKLLETVWQNDRIRYEVIGKRYGKNAEKLVLVERIIDVGFLDRVKQEELNEYYRDKRRMIETGSF